MGSLSPLIDYWAIPTFSGRPPAVAHVSGVRKARKNAANDLQVPKKGPVPVVPTKRLAQPEGCAGMTRLSLFSSPFLLGFDQFEQAVDRISKASTTGYPPYNIEQTSENGLRISIAVAGFSMDDLDVSIDGNQLLIKGRQSDDRDRVYLHKGLATRQFQRSFVLAEGIEVSGASLDNGLLNVDLLRPEVEARIRKIEIDGAAGSSRGPETLNVRPNKSD